MKDRIVVGDTLDFTTSVDKFPPTDGFTLKYRLVPRLVVGTAIVITAITEGDHYRVQIAAGTTATYAAGEYSWTSWVEKSGARYSVDSGQVTIAADPGLVPGPYDNRSYAQTCLDNIEAVIQKRATKDQKAYTIFGRALERTPVDDLIKLRDMFRKEVEDEAAIKSIAAGNDSPRNIGIRFSRP